MSNTTDTNLLTPPQEPTPPICQPNDTECIKRWIEAFSDCD